MPRNCMHPYLAGIFRVCSTRTVHCWKRETLRIPTMYPSIARQQLRSSRPHFATSHSSTVTVICPVAVVMTACMTAVTGLTNHSEWLKFDSFLQTPRAPGQLSTCGFFPRVGSTAVHPGKYTVRRDQFTGAGRLPATRSYFNSKQMYSTTVSSGSPERLECSLEQWNGTHD